MNSVFHLVYVSTARQLLDAEALESLLIQARERNERLAITGMLIYGAGNFIQALEGPHEAVLDVYASIQRDQRHHHIITLVEFDDDERDFPGWWMAYAHEPHPEKIKGCINLLKSRQEATDKLADSRFVRRLLLNFLNTNR
jgi:hypothetical protein